MKNYGRGRRDEGVCVCVCVRGGGCLFFHFQERRRRRFYEFFNFTGMNFDAYNYVSVAIS
jgi:hypothetical protein